MFAHVICVVVFPLVVGGTGTERRVRKKGVIVLKSSWANVDKGERRLAVWSLVTSGQVLAGLATQRCLIENNLLR